MVARDFGLVIIAALAGLCVGIGIYNKMTGNHDTKLEEAVEDLVKDNAGLDIE